MNAAGVGLNVTLVVPGRLFPGILIFAPAFPRLGSATYYERAEPRVEAEDGAVILGTADSSGSVEISLLGLHQATNESASLLPLKVYSGAELAQRRDLENDAVGVGAT